MLINVGSKNPTKITAVAKLVKGHKLFKDAVVKGVEVEVEEFGHPKSLQDTIQGAKNRANQSYKNCNYSFGLESGLFPSKQTKSGYFETTACAIFDGEQFHIGLSPSFEWPAEMVKMILKGYDGSQAFKALGLTDHKKIGVEKGGIHVLTHGKINRTQLNELAVIMALIHLENSSYY